VFITSFSTRSLSYSVYHTSPEDGVYWATSQTNTDPIHTRCARWRGIKRREELAPGPGIGAETDLRSMARGGIDVQLRSARISPRLAPKRNDVGIIVEQVWSRLHHHGGRSVTKSGRVSVIEKD
jgi:hypothetical protein